MRSANGSPHEIWAILIRVDISYGLSLHSKAAGVFHMSSDQFQTSEKFVKVSMKTSIFWKCISLISSTVFKAYFFKFKCACVAVTV